MSFDIADVDGGGSPYSVVDESVMFVALGKDHKENESVFIYAVQHAKPKGMNICVLHVHQPAQKIPIMGTKLPISMVQENQVKEHHEKEREEMHKILDQYMEACELAKVRAVKVVIEMDSIEKGIVHLISEHGIKWLVMGAAAKKSYSRKMKAPKSTKAIHVCREAPSYCQIWFVCKGNLVYTRESRLDGVNEQDYRPSFLASPSIASTASSSRSPSTFEGENVSVSSGGATPLRTSEAGITFEGLYGRNPSVGSQFFESNERVEESSLFSFPMSEESESQASLNFRAASSIGVALPEEEDMNDELYTKLDQYMAEAESFQRALHAESIKRKKAEKEAIDAMRKAKTSEMMYNQELHRRGDVENKLQKCSEEAKKVKYRLDEVMEELRIAQVDKSFLENKIKSYNDMIEELKEKLFSAVDMLQRFRNV